MSDRTLRSLDRLVRSGRFANRTEAIRAAIDELTRAAERQQIDAAIREGYGRAPDAPDRWLEAATKAMVLAEPW